MEEPISFFEICLCVLVGFAAAKVIECFSSVLEERRKLDEHIVTSKGRVLFVEVGEGNVVSITDAVSKTRV